MKEQIEEMAADLCLIDRCKHLPQEECNMTTCAHCEAEALYNAGYRKQEWISVEDGLPEKGQHVLCLYPQKDYGSKCVVDYAETADGFFAEQYLFGRPSHWMPLPEPPKMEGGAE